MGFEEEKHQRITQVDAIWRFTELYACLTHTYHILYLRFNLLNKCKKLVSKCTYEDKSYRSNYKSIPPKQIAKFDKCTPSLLLDFEQDVV